MSKTKVMVADDMDMAINIIVLALKNIEEIGEIKIAKDGEEEYQKIQEEEFDLVFTDNQMPKMNGLDVIENVNNLNLKHRPEFVLVTGDTITYQEMQNFKIMKVIRKPMNEKDIEDAVREFNEMKEFEENLIKEEKAETKKKQGFLEKILKK